MTGTDDPCALWLAQAQIAADRLTAEQRGLLQAAFAFRQRCGDDYYSNRLLSHFLLHCHSGLKVAQIARLVGISRPTASHQQGISSREAIQAAHHRLAGRPHGKLLPRYAGPIAEFILTHGDATRYDVLAETLTVLKGEGPGQAVRTIVCREVRPGPKKDRWHPLYTTCAADTEGVLTIFRARQGHEQAHRVEVHDLLVDAVPCGYDKESPDGQRPRFHRGPLQMLGWLVALVYNAVADLGDRLGEDYAGEHVRTLRRRFFNRPGQLYETPEALVVYLDPFAGQEALVPVIDAINAKQHRVPWLDNRRLVMSLTPTGPIRAGP